RSDPSAPSVEEMEEAMPRRSANPVPPRAARACGRFQRFDASALVRVRTPGPRTEPVPKKCPLAPKELVALGGEGSGLRGFEPSRAYWSFVARATAPAAQMLPIESLV